MSHPVQGVYHRLNAHRCRVTRLVDAQTQEARTIGAGVHGQRKGMKLGFRSVDWEYVSVFRIAYRARTHARTVLVELQDDDSGLVGRGEALGVSYRGEDVDTMLAELTKIASSDELSLSPAKLQEMMPAGGARNALDCALWDLQAKRTGLRAWQLAGFQTVRPLTSAYTLGLDTPEAMALAAAAAKQYSLLKIKL